MILLSVLKIPPMFFSVLSVKFTGRVKFGTMRLKNSISDRDSLNTTKIPVYKIITPEESRTFGRQPGEFLSYQSMALLLRTLHPEVNDIFLLSLIIVNLACSLELVITRGGALKRVGRALWCTVKWNFLLILLWLPVLGLFQLPYIDAAFDHILTVLRLVGMTQLAGCVRSDWLWWSSTVTGWMFLVVTFIGYALVVGWLHHFYGRTDPVGASADEFGLGRFWSSQWEAFLSTVLQPTSMSRPSWAHSSRGSAEVGMELLIERLAVPNFWLQPVISSQYVHNLPIWKHRGPCRVDSDVGSDLESQPSQDSAAEPNHGSSFTCPPLEDCDNTAVAARPPGSNPEAEPPTGSNAEFDVNWPTWFGKRRPLMFVCERCRALQTSATTRSHHELEQERLESESACAKYLMDGNYRCMCGGGGALGGPATTQRCSQTRPPERTSDHDPVSDDFGGLPAGIIAMTDCSICLESYKYGVLLCGLPCGHSFHQQCIMGWLSRDNHCCPICRWPAYKAKPCNMHQHCE